MITTTHDIFVSFFNNEVLMLVVFIAMLTVVSIDKSLSELQKKLTYSFALLCMLYALLAFIDFGMESYLIPVNVTVRIFCATIRHIIKPVTLLLVTCGLQEKFAKNKFLYIPLILNTILYLINVGTGICFSINADNELVVRPLSYLGVAIFLFYVFVLAFAYQKYPLMRMKRVKTTSVILLLIIPLAELGELLANRNVLATAILVSNILEYELLIVLKNNIQLKDKENALINTQLASISDEMTETFNRRAYDQRIEQESKRKDDRPNFTIIMCDINGLKNVNDTYGHKTGDEMVVGAAKCLKAAFGKYGDIYRIGGDEFTALINCSEAQLTEALQSLDSFCKSWSHPLIDELAISKGYARVSENDEKDIHHLIMIADQNMYVDKQEYYKAHDRRKRS